MLSSQQKFSIGYSILTVLGLLLIHTMFFAPQSENLSYRDFKTLLKAGKVIDLTPDGFIVCVFEDGEVGRR